MDSEDDSFALLLSHEYTIKYIQCLGIGALKGIDSVRFHALEEANKHCSCRPETSFLHRWIGTPI
ncbi:hypothetical protein JG688_00002730 [Phytophthora aleatoria]|uniref:Uncharacterized protein n=1 Tax=Phytophthora aleatoria TaxID=2496075 RepID=A0A8J5J3T3_9STRA|nr:hypothetical protein JG688_00002730 [Phytophthora aleatoria]